MSETKVRVKNISSKVTNEYLHRLFSLIGETLMVEIVEEDKNEVRYADITFKTREQALEAIHDYDTKIILKNKVSLALVDTKTPNTPQESAKVYDKEFVGELVYEIALRKYGTNAAKLTGMICEAILELSADQPLMYKIIESEQSLTELVSVNYTFRPQKNNWDI